MEGTLGRVTGVSELDPEKLFIQFDNDQINKWLYKDNKGTVRDGPTLDRQGARRIGCQASGSLFQSG